MPTNKHVRTKQVVTHIKTIGDMRKEFEGMPDETPVVFFQYQIAKGGEMFHKRQALLMHSVEDGSFKQMEIELYKNEADLYSQIETYEEINNAM